MGWAIITFPGYKFSMPEIDRDFSFKETNSAGGQFNQKRPFQDQTRSYQEKSKQGYKHFDTLKNIPQSPKRK
jgi:hypothetical protein